MIPRLFRKFAYYPRSLMLRLEVAAARRSLRGPHAWSVMQQLDIPGFGTDLVRLDFPPPVLPSPRWGHSQPLHFELERILNASADVQNSLLATLLPFADECLSWPALSDPLDTSLPWRDNPFLPLVDMLALFGMIHHWRPRRYVEIGSGISTRVAWRARRAAAVDMTIFSIDPSPRVELGNLCDRVFRNRLEDFPLADLVELSGEGCLLFFDGSHRCFPSSDVTVFFLEVLPRLRPGTLVQIHDIFLPADYPSSASDRLWSEQYLLAAYLLGGGERVRVVLPCFHLGMREPSSHLLRERFGEAGGKGVSFWLEITR